ncbi:hypothetical protein [Neobacillus sp. YIM B06451]|uniref:hypothetical protein n=1 Tax=Neobacillus sp. YIM B06451 TaxID=3070994 RepID=UPI00292FA340|nr:hypothetical protein [Neobacillus sp. YIM B06451]
MDFPIPKVNPTLFFEDSGEPSEIELHHKNNHITMIVPHNSSLFTFIDKEMIYEKLSISQNICISLFTLLPIEDYDEYKKNIIDKNFTEEDKKTLAYFYHGSLSYGSFLEFMYLVAHFPNDIDIPIFNKHNTVKYKKVFDHIVQSIGLDSSFYNGKILHDVIQGKAKWKTWPEEILSPSVGYKFSQPRINKDATWDDFYKFSHKHFLSWSEMDLIKKKAAEDLLDSSILFMIEERWNIPFREVEQYIMEVISVEKQKKWDILLNLGGYSSLDIVRKKISDIQKSNKRDKLYVNEDCKLCKTSLKEASIRLEDIPNKVFQALRGVEIPVCGDCLIYCTQAWGNISMPKRQKIASTRVELIDLIKKMAYETGVIPSSNPLTYLAQVPRKFLLYGLVLLWQMPFGEDRKRIAPDGWLGLLAEANILDKTNGKIFGRYVTAKDGHPCRSLAEKYIDDWLFSHGIKHDIEPAYPYDRELNPNGMRADFKVGDTYVEYFGLISNEDYRKKTEIKIDLAQKYHIPLIEIYPEHLNDKELGRKFSSYLNKHIAK